MRYKTRFLRIQMYLPDIQDPKTMSSVIINHACFSIDMVKMEAKKLAPKFDSYNRLNETAAKRFLFKSIKESLDTKVWEQVKQTDPFSVVWIMLINLVMSTSIEKYNNLKDAIRKHSSFQYPAQNLHELASDCCHDAKLLEKAIQYVHNLTLVMRKSFLEAGGDNKSGESFRSGLHLLCGKLDNALLHISFLDKKDATAYMIQEEMTYDNICKTVEEEYKNFSENGMWSPTKHAVNSKAITTKPLANMAKILKGKELQILNLVQSITDSTCTSGPKKGGSCHNCGAKDHWRNECPKLKCPTSTGGKPASRPNHGNHTMTSSTLKTSKKSWHFTPPGPGKPTSKIHQQHQFKWCGKCNRWTTTHDTATHTGGKGKSNGTPSTLQAHLCLVPEIQDPLAWHLAFLSPSNVSQLIRMFLVPMLVGSLLGSLLVIALTYDIPTIILYLLSCTHSLLMLGEQFREHRQYSAGLLWFLLINFMVSWKSKCHCKYPDVMTCTSCGPAPTSHSLPCQANPKTRALLHVTATPPVTVWHPDTIPLLPATQLMAPLTCLGPSTNIIQLCLSMPWTLRFQMMTLYLENIFPLNKSTVQRACKELKLCMQFYKMSLALICLLLSSVAEFFLRICMALALCVSSQCQLHFSSLTNNAPFDSLQSSTSLLTHLLLLCVYSLSPTCYC